jgi:hypothetical protein
MFLYTKNVFLLINAVLYEAINTVEPSCQEIMTAIRLGSTESTPDIGWPGCEGHRISIQYTTKVSLIT